MTSEFSQQKKVALLNWKKNVAGFYKEIFLTLREKGKYDKILL